MIQGVGTDILDLARIQALLAGKNRARFLQRILTPTEYKRLESIHANHRVEEFVAGRFALKEAVSKALGCGIGGKLGFQDIEIQADASGKPHCSISDAAFDRLGLQSDLLIHISVSHSKQQVVAFAVAERRSLHFG